MIYGDTLVYFAEQLKRIECFKQVVRVGSGYDKVGDSFFITGIVQSGAGDETIGAAGRLSQYAGWRVLAAPSKRTLWTYTNLDMLTYFRWEGSTYIVKDRIKWSEEGGFNIFIINRVVGDDGTQTEELPIKGGTF